MQERLKKLFSKINKLNILLSLKALSVGLVPILILTPELGFLSPSIRVDEVVVVFMSALYAILLLRREVKLTIKPMDLVFSAFFVSIVASILYGYLVLQIPFSYKDVFEVAKLAKYWLVFRILVEIPWTKKDISLVIKITILSTIASLSVAYLQYLDIFNSARSIGLIYTSEYHVIRIVRYGRVVGTLKNPNDYGLFLIIPLATIFAYSFLSRFRPRKGDWYIYTLPFFLSVLAMSLSRTALVSIFVGLASLSAVLFFKKEKIISKEKVLKVFAYFIICSFLGFFIVKAIPHKGGDIDIYKRTVIGLREVSGDESLGEGYYSWSARQERWRYAVDRFEESPIFGRGPAKAIIYSTGRANIDNEYLNILMRYGIIGLVIYLSFFLIIIKDAIKVYGGHRNRDLFSLKSIVLAMPISFIAYNLLSGTFYNQQLIVLLLYFYAILLKYYEQKTTS